MALLDIDAAMHSESPKLRYVPPISADATPIFLSHIEIVLSAQGYVHASQNR
jgi:hypothetical protein